MKVRHAPTRRDLYEEPSSRETTHKRLVRWRSTGCTGNLRCRADAEDAEDYVGWTASELHCLSSTPEHGQNSQKGPGRQGPDDHALGLYPGGLITKRSPGLCWMGTSAGADHLRGTGRWRSTFENFMSLVRVPAPKVGSLIPAQPP